MNKSRIEWTDFTWNPVTGCWGPGGSAENPKWCFYCYAMRMACRFNVGQRPDGSFPPGFFPTFYPERLNQPAKVKKPSKIFVCSMGDLFGDWVPQEWIEAVLNRTQRGDYSQHIYQFLTKNPKRLKDFNPWPDNAWVGTTVTNQADADERLPWLLQVDAPVRFVSHEPLLGAIKIRHGQGLFPTKTYSRSGQYGQDLMITKTPVLSWAIIGAMTGPGAVRPEVDWVMGLAQQYRDAGVPLFLKDNLGFKDQPQEFPKKAPK